MEPLRAVIFDVDGTLADTERDGHRPAFNAAFAVHGLDIVWDPVHYGELLKITGGRRRIAHDLRSRGYGESADGLASAIHQTKTDIFRDSVVAGTLGARRGVLDLIDSLRGEGIRIAVATTGRRRWVHPLIAMLLGADAVDAMVTGDDVRRLKPDPEVYRLALGRLGLAPHQAIAVEDSAIGLQSALRAGLSTVVVRTEYTAGQDFSGAAAVLAEFDSPPPLLAPRCRSIHGDAATARRV